MVFAVLCHRHPCGDPHETDGITTLPRTALISRPEVPAPGDPHFLSPELGWVQPLPSLAANPGQTPTGAPTVLV